VGRPMSARDGLEDDARDALRLDAPYGLDALGRPRRCVCRTGHGPDCPALNWEPDDETDDESDEESDDEE